ncbi:MAG TPA: hypothetical protein GX716_08240 [Firmicutes bacterium]|nr:hypothetical protein [Candidatus Fermentithermobacillaceae bacterium]
MNPESGRLLRMLSRRQYQRHCSWGLFTPDDVTDLPHVSCLMLNLPVMVSTGTGSESKWRILGRTSFSSGSVSESMFDRLEPNQAILNTQSPEIRDRMTPGTRVRAFVPMVAPGKGSPNFIGAPRPQEGINYVDFGNGQWIDVTIVAVTNEVFCPDALICRLEWLQGVTGGHAYVNWATSDASLSEPALANLAGGGGWQVFESSRILYGVTAELSAIEESGHFLWLAILSVAAIMSLTTAAYVISTDAKDIILLQVLGVGKTQAAAVVALPLALSAFVGSLAGVLLSRLLLFPVFRTVSFSVADLSAFVLAPVALMGLAAFLRAVSSIKRLPELEALDDYE